MSERDDEVVPEPGKPFSWSLTPGDPIEAVPPAPPAPQTEPYLPPTAAFTMPADAATTPFEPRVGIPTAPFSSAPFSSAAGIPTAPFTPGADLQQLPPDRSQWMSAPVDPALDGVTEVIEAELVGLGAPDGEGVEASALDSLFGETQFREYADELISAPPPRASSEGGAKPPKPPRGAIPRTQKILLGIAGGLLAALALVALFLVGTRLSDSLGPAPAITPTPTASPGPIVLPIGPVEPGDYAWDELLGGECLSPYESAWQDNYTVVDCAVPHPAQMIYRGLFDDSAVTIYPGVEELQKRINLLCTAPTIIDYAKAGTANDIQVEASFAPDATDWAEGNRTYFCFVSRSGGEDFTVSIAIPQLVPTPTPSATPAG